MSVTVKSIATPDRVPLTRALISVSDKTGIADFARTLAARGVELVSTGGTRAAIAAAGVPVIDVSDITGFPEIMDGRVKTLHPKVHGGLLAVRADPEHAEALTTHGIPVFDLLVIDLYPFEETVAKGGERQAIIETIDIGGPAMIRAAAKNHAYLSVVVDPADYGAVLTELDGHGGATTARFRRALAAKAFSRTAAYDAAIARWATDAVAAETEAAAEAEPTAPRWVSFGGTLVQAMRYGENPHQAAAFYRSAPARAGVATARQVQGKALSYNNLNDTDAAYELVAEFDPAASAAVAIIKHANPCGVARGADLAEAYRKALACDPVSAFGGIVALNRTLDAAAAALVTEIFTEVIIAPDATAEAIEIVAAKKNLRLLLAGGLPDPRAAGLVAKTLAGGLLVQSRDNAVIDDLDLKVVTKRAPTEAELADLKFSWRIVKHVKSNAIVYAKGGATVGIGAGQMSRVDSARIAAWKAADAAKAAGLADSPTRGSVVASDAFFPFADGLLAAVEAGATAVIQPGGSMRDAEVIATADAHGLAMVFTGVRHFRH
ncbi:bifunctional phosphoribosylaminoimidazolecarboxamide formyltransferase/IMP cyclohydrolase [Segnochrobactrum spirostomi]|uniref:Bifunctional purine biosynthesis protein PurH n=1 Tax=Segnochrobactrum spirostomi TaxID=2608987 RepID=A0A6A7Y2W3_9HYPH|nr:bifunctional phosphoribosylaminoimidazolecarboxamide formyltransferase/IMP cyclohydrolase [Segnochrobactrum spirostomi]MQT13444.1 bifunctional phosphoribosylaminoimidazolecarboxamide formyltransferase/IMP cyclohydrolase [Segnochrobactrum spirostomi]